MTETIGIILLNIAFIGGFYGIGWRLWDNRASAPLWLLGISLACAIIGELML